MKPIENKVSYYRRFQTFAINKMAPFSDIEKDSLSYWRVRILFAIVFTALLLSLPAFIPITALVIKAKMWGIAIFDGVAWLIGVGLLILPGLKYKMRAAIALLIAYVVGLIITISLGPLSGGPVWLFAFAVLMAVLMGLKAAIMALTLNAITITILGCLMTTGVFDQTFPFFNTTLAMIVAGASFMILNTTAALSVTVLVKGLVSAHRKKMDLTSTLERERSQLIEAKKELELEVEERKQAENELQRERDKLQDALTNVKTLSGMLPICASCKKIRDDKGYWNKVETYIHDRSEAKFTHSICPECEKKMYSEYYEEE